MEIVEIIRVAADLGLGPLIAILMIYWYRQDTNQREELEKAKAEKELERARAEKELERARAEKELETAKQKFFIEREDKLLLIKTLQEHTETTTELIVLLKRLNHSES